MKILCFGDSNTYGYDPRGYFGGRYDPENRWPEILGRRTGWEICNDGRNGRQIPLREELSGMDADLVIVMLGTNDLLQGASAGEAAVRMKGFLDQAVPVWGRLLLVAPPPVKRGAWVPSEALIRESLELGEEYRKLARTRKLPFADTRDWGVEMGFDGVHFTEAGHHTFGRKMAEVLAALTAE